MSADLRPLRPYQDRALLALRASLVSGHKRPLLQMATGAGKTLLAAHIVSGALGKGKRVAFAVPAVTLVDQTMVAFAREGIHCVGVMQGYHPQTDHEQPVQVCSVQTLARRRKPAVDLLIVDEAHVMHRSLLTWLDELTAAGVPVIALSATPWTRGLGKYYDDLIVGATTRGLIDEGYLAPFVAFAPSNPDLSSLSTVAGDFQQDELGAAMDTPAVTGDIVVEWLRRGENRPTFAFCVNRKHAAHICERFVEAGVPAEFMDCETCREDRQAIFDRFTAGETRVIVNVGVLTTGVDLDVRCVIDAHPTKSRMLYVQSIGRGLRTAAGKTNCLILDHAGNALRLGLVTDIGQDHLDDGRTENASQRKKREASTPLPKLCERCKAVLPIAAKLCEACGEPVRAFSSVREIAGNLVELGSRRTGERAVSDWEKRRFYAELLGLSEERGCKPGWAAHKFREKFGNFPNGYDRFPMEPSIATRSWAKSRTIAFFKGRRAHG